jgi:hypothetical protein
MITRTPRALGRLSTRSLSTLTARPAVLALPRHVVVAPFTLTSRAKSTIVERSPLHSVPSKAEAVGQPAVDTKKGKVWESAHEAVKDIKAGSLVLSSGEIFVLYRVNGGPDRFQVLVYVVPPRLSSRP